ncbi:MAG: late competence development ComFB family protein [Leptolyngbya sp. SIO1D8]|nr:late competence development ComFB family protein [Leptolyngbya sp. SIO1D8]
MEELNLLSEEQHYLNIMEELVVQEAEKCLQRLPLRVRDHVHLEEVVTYALNRLPTLYACSQKGVQHQRQLAQHKMQSKIEDAVRQAISAVQIDPIRLSQPIQLNQDKDAEAVLQALRSFFDIPSLNWATALEQLNALRHNSQSNQTNTATVHPKAWKPGTYGREVAWTRHQRQGNHNQEKSKPVSKQTESKPKTPESHPEIGWDDARYRL